MEKNIQRILLALFIVSIMVFAVGCKAGYDNYDDMTNLSELEDLEDDDTGFEELVVSEEDAAEEAEATETESRRSRRTLRDTTEEVEETEVVETVTEDVEETVEAEPVETTQSVKKIVVTEGEMVVLQLKGTDPDGDVIEYTFSAPLDEEGKWETASGDAGVYEVEITASDGEAEVKKTIQIEVLKANEPPMIEGLSDVTIEEGEKVTIAPKVSDPDGDRVTYTISGWMETLEKGTGYEDAGTYYVTITATDGEFEVSQDITVVVTDVNRAPDFDILLG